MARTASAQLPAVSGLALLTSTQATLAFHWHPADSSEEVAYEAQMRSEPRQGTSALPGEWESLYKVRRPVFMK